MAPPVDIFETDKGLVVLADLPGVDKAEVNVRVDNGILTIQGKPAYEKPENLLYNEFNMVEFYRQFELSDETDQDKITAKITHGVLELHLPKAEKAKPKRIDVKVQSE